MKKKLSLLLVLVLVFSMLAVGCGSEEAAPETFPAKEIELVVPYSAGGATDMMARPFAEKLSAILGQNVVVLNTPGASGSVAAMELLSEDADGYKLLLASAANMTIVPIATQLDYSYEDFTPVSQMTHTPIAIAVPADSEYQTLEALIEAAKAGSLKYSSAGANSTDQIAMEILAGEAGFTMAHMPFDGGAEAVAQCMGGHVDATVGSLPDVISQYQAGTLKVLAVFADERQEVMPDVPCMKELGYEGMAYGSWVAVVGPAGMDAEVVATLEAAIEEAIADADLQATWDKMSVYYNYLNASDLAAKMVKVNEEFGAVAAASIQ